MAGNGSFFFLHRNYLFEGDVVVVDVYRLAERESKIRFSLSLDEGAHMGDG